MVNNMEAEWIKRVREESKRKFEELLKKSKKIDGMYEIPKKYEDASILYSSKSSKNEFIKARIKEQNDVYKEMQYQVPEEIGKNLQSIYENEEYTLMIHRTDYDMEQIKNQMFQKGLPMRDTDYTCNLSTYNHFPTILQQIKFCNDYKNSQGCIIVKMPKNIDLPLYYEYNDLLCLLPEYIYGYIKVNEEKVENMFLNPLYKDNHDYDPEGLYYDEILTPMQYKEQIENAKSK